MCMNVRSCWSCGRVEKRIQVGYNINRPRSTEREDSMLYEREEREDCSCLLFRLLEDSPFFLIATHKDLGSQLHTTSS